MIVNRCLGTHTTSTMLDIFIYETGTNGGIDHTCWEDLTQGMFDAPSLPQIHISLQLRELRETAANTRDMGYLWYCRSDLWCREYENHQGGSKIVFINKIDSHWLPV